jgi:hypothetical protein
MPGFDAEDLDDWQSFRKLMTAMATINPFVTFRGVLFVDRLGEDRVKTSTYKILTWLKHFCGDKYMPNTTIITTFWDTLNNDGIKEKLARYDSWSAGELLQPLLHHGAKTYHHGLINGDELKTFHHGREQVDRAQRAREMIHRYYSEPTDLFLQIYTEISQGCSLEETTAGNWLKYGSAARSTRPILEDDEGNSQFSHRDPGIRADAIEGIRIECMPDTSHKARHAPSTSSEQKAQAQSSWSWLRFRAEDAMPWIKLLWTAARFYRHAASSSYGSDFRYDRYMGEEQEFMGGEQEFMGEEQEFMDEEGGLFNKAEAFNVRDTVPQEPSSSTSCAVM